MPAAVKHTPHEHQINNDGSDRKRVTYPWKDLGIGDWFYVAVSTSTLAKDTTPAMLWGNIDWDIRAVIKKKFPSRSFMAIQMDEGVKVWRTK